MRSGPPRKWTDECIERELRLFTAGRTTWPTDGEFIEARAWPLRSAVLRYGGRRYWADRLGLEGSPALLGPLTNAEAIAEAKAVIEAHGHLPGMRVLYRLGHPRLASAVYRNGGASRFRERFDV